MTRRLLAAAALALLILGGVWTRELRWQGLIALFIGGCLWWTALHLSRVAWLAAQAADPRK
jgi:hypothetical protein